MMSRLPDGINRFTVCVFAAMLAVAAMPVSTLAQEALQFDPHVLDHLKSSVISITSLVESSGIEEVKVGTGFVFHTNGYAVTSRSVVINARDIQIGLSDGTLARARMIYENSSSGLALLKISAAHLPPVESGSSQSVDSHSCLILIGNSMGIFPSVTMALNRGIDRRGILHLGAVIPPGNTGSPVFNNSGHWVGMLLGRTSAGNNADGEGTRGLALPASVILEELSAIVDHFEKHPGWVGLTVDELGQGQGVVVKSIADGGPAQRGGLSVGDTIVAFQGKGFLHAVDLELKVTSRKPNEEITLTIRRDGSTVDHLLRVEQRPWFRKR